MILFYCIFYIKKLVRFRFEEYKKSWGKGIQFPHERPD